MGCVPACFCCRGPCFWVPFGHLGNCPVGFFSRMGEGSYVEVSI